MITMIIQNNLSMNLSHQSNLILWPKFQNDKLMNLSHLDIFHQWLKKTHLWIWVFGDFLTMTQNDSSMNLSHWTLLVQWLKMTHLILWIWVIRRSFDNDSKWLINVFESESLAIFREQTQNDSWHPPPIKPLNLCWF